MSAPTFNLFSVAILKMACLCFCVLLLLLLGCSLEVNVDILLDLTRYQAGVHVISQSNLSMSNGINISELLPL